MEEAKLNATAFALAEAKFIAGLRAAEAVLRASGHPDVVCCGCVPLPTLIATYQALERIGAFEFEPRSVTCSNCGSQECEEDEFGSGVCQLCARALERHALLAR